MNTHGIDERAGDEHLLHMPPDPDSEEARAKARRTICRNGHDTADRADLLEKVGVIRRDPKTKRWVLI